jgi:HK97 family phage portal protein
MSNVTKTSRYKMVTERGNGFYSWDGRLYHSDIVRACIRPKTKAIGKLIAKHIRNDTEGIKTNPEAYIRFLLEEPNPYMTGQMMQEKVSNQLSLNNNAFILIIKDDYGYPSELYPIPCSGVEAIYVNNELYLKFYFVNGKTSTFPYTEIIHLRDDFHDNDIFGESPGDALSMLMETINTIDQGLISAVKNSAIIQWLLKFSTTTRPEDLKKNAKEFADNYLNIDSESIGVAAVSSTADAIRIEPKDYVPNASQTDRTKLRLYAFFNTNEKIVMSTYNENEWISYYEAVIEPLAIQMSGEYTRKIFTRRERGFGNKIIFESSNLTFASMQTKLALQAMVDRGAMTPNEWREVLNLSPVDGGDKPIRRLDTQVVNQIDSLLKNMTPDNCIQISNEVSVILNENRKGAKDIA